MKNQGFLSIGEVAAILEVPVHTLRYWEKEFGLLLKPARTPGSHRLYGPEELQVLRRIRKMLREEQYSIAGARRKLERDPRPPLAAETQKQQGSEFAIETGVS